MTKQKKLVVVTGASRGVGLEVCRLLVTNDYRVVAVSRTMSSDLEALLSNQLTFEPFDLEKKEDIHRFCQELQKKYGRPWGLVNNAAVGQNSILATLHESDISKLLKVNLEAPMLLSKYLLRPMMLNQSGCIINITSIAAQTGFNGLSVYGATKAGLEGFSKSLAREVGKAGIRVNNIAPGYMQTNMTEGLSDELDKIVRRSAIKKLVRTEDIASSVLFLLSDSAASITGTTLTVDAGATA